MEMEGMIADSPRHSTFLCSSSALVCLALDAKVHDMISADCAVVYNDVPRPERNRIPLLNFESLFAVTCGLTRAGLG